MIDIDREIWGKKFDSLSDTIKAMSNAISMIQKSLERHERVIMDQNERIRSFANDSMKLWDAVLELQGKEHGG